MLHRLRYAPFLAQLVVTRRCNLRCGYCNEFDDHSQPVPTAALERRIDKLAALGTWAVELTGGEPLLHPEIAQLVAHAKKRARTVMLITNGFLLDEKRIEALNAAGLDDMQVSIDGVEPNDVTVKVLRPLRPKLEVLARTARFRVTINGVIGSAASNEVLEVIAFAREKGFRPRVCLIHRGDGQLELPAEQRALYSRVKRQLGKRFAEAGDYRTRLMGEGRAPFKCRAGSRYLYVDEFGIVRWCSQQMGSFGVPLDQYAPADLARQFHTRKACNERCTVGCVRTCSAVDQWRAQSLAPEPRAVATPLFQIAPHAPARPRQPSA